MTVEKIREEKEILEREIERGSARYRSAWSCEITLNNGYNVTWQNLI